MRVIMPRFEKGSEMFSEFAMGMPDADSHATFAGNRNPEVNWTDFPEETQSFAVICVDVDAPADGTDANTEGKTIPYDAERTDFYHWVLVDIPVDITKIPEGAVCDGVTEGGKPTGKSEYGLAGYNDYTNYFKGYKDMEGTYGGYDGPFPPWNDERGHRYYFRVYALDVDSLGLDPDGNFSGQDALDAMDGHILAQDEWMGTYGIYTYAQYPNKDKPE
jgi:Raf kinase inhibitor-like YbhB/YbcL family protein